MSGRVVYIICTSVMWCVPISKSSCGIRNERVWKMRNWDKTKPVCNCGRNFWFVSKRKQKSNRNSMSSLVRSFVVNGSITLRLLPAIMFSVGFCQIIMQLINCILQRIHIQVTLVARCWWAILFIKEERGREISPNTHARLQININSVEKRAQVQLQRFVLISSRFRYELWPFRRKTAYIIGYHSNLVYFLEFYLRFLQTFVRPFFHFL